MIRTGFGAAGAPTSQRDRSQQRGHSLRDLPHDRQMAIETASEQLASWDKLASIAMARGEVRDDVLTEAHHAFLRWRLGLSC